MLLIFKSLECNKCEVYTLLYSTQKGDFAPVITRLSLEGIQDVVKNRFANINVDTLEVIELEGSIHETIKGFRGLENSLFEDVRVVMEEGVIMDSPDTEDILDLETLEILQFEKFMDAECRRHYLDEEYIIK